MLEEVAPFAVVATVRYFDLLTIHVILDLMVPHSSPMRVVPVYSLQSIHTQTDSTRGTRNEYKSDNGTSVNLSSV